MNGRLYRDSATVSTRSISSLDLISWYHGWSSNPRLRSNRFAVERRDRPSRGRMREMMEKCSSLCSLVCKTQLKMQDLFKTFHDLDLSCLARKMRSIAAHSFQFGILYTAINLSSPTETIRLPSELYLTPHTCTQSSSISLSRLPDRNVRRKDGRFVVAPNPTPALCHQPTTTRSRCPWARSPRPAPRTCGRKTWPRPRTCPCFCKCPPRLSRSLCTCDEGHTRHGP